MRQIPTLAGAVAPRLLLFSLLWVAVSGGAAGSWVVGAPAVLAATAASIALRTQRPGAGGPLPPPIALLRFAGFFLRESVRGGFDVARRAVDPRLPIAPGFVEFRLEVPPGLVRVFVVDVVSLLPGTLSVSLDGDRLRLHVIDRRIDAERPLREVERQAAVLFGVDGPRRRQ